MPKNTSEALKLIAKAENAQADLIEVRLDRLKSIQNLADFSAATKLPLIATVKLQAENGFFAGTETERQIVLFKSAECGFKYVDVDLAGSNIEKTVSKLKTVGAEPIVSFHKYDGSLSLDEMNRVLELEKAKGASVCKLVTTAKKIDDNLNALNFINANGSKEKIVCFCMGNLGMVSRLLSPLFGAFFTFASLESGSETANGQMSIADMRKSYALLEAKG
jgi:3-dehydroquinate dehydratase type I